MKIHYEENENLRNDDDNLSQLQEPLKNTPSSENRIRDLISDEINKVYVRLYEELREKKNKDHAANNKDASKT